MATEVIMPQLGESVVEGTIGRWLVAEGEEVKQYQPLLEVVTDKVDAEVPAPASGVLLKILVPEGQTVAVGTVLAYIGQPGEALPKRPDSVPTSRPGPEPKVTKKTTARGDGRERGKPQGRRRITPVVARIAAEHGIDLNTAPIQGTGRGGRITKKDILAYVERMKAAPAREAVEELPPWEQPGTGELFRPTEEVGAPPPPEQAAPPPPLPSPSPERAAPSPPPPSSAGEVIPLTRMRKAIAEHMVHSKRTAPHVTTVMEADMSRIVAYRERWQAEFRRREGIRLTFTPFFVRAVVEGLKAVPQVNSSFTDDGILLHRQIHIGIAVALEDGLIVPVIRDADRLSLSGLQRAVTDLAERARSKQLRPDEVQGATFTITNHGVSGSLFATPIINQPNVGILGIGAIQKRPVVVTVEGVDSIAIKPMCYLSFTFDHRVLDGAVADRFLAKVVEVLEHWS